MKIRLKLYGVFTVCTIIMAIAGSGISAAFKYDVTAKVESMRKDGLLTLRFDSRPMSESYFMLEGERVIGGISIVSFHEDGSGGFRVIAYYTLEKKSDEDLVRAGLEIGLRAEAERKTRDYSEPQKRETLIYKNRIVTATDGREMVLIPAGKFIFGNNNAHPDEGPEQVVHLGDYYIDRFEVSNADFLKYVRKTNSQPPRSWKGDVPADAAMDLPVMATWKEAEAYARWADKRLPSEMQWEKAARGPLPALVYGKDAFKTGAVRLYPWGRAFESGRSNTLEFWDNKQESADLKRQYSRGLLPVSSFQGQGDSPFGVVNMIGNAPEWTADWYRSYPDSVYADRRFGTRFKVIRGGGWFSRADEVRLTRRQIGGIPNLYTDIAGGFRCVKAPGILDIESDGN